LQPKAEDLDVCKAYNLVAGAGKLVNLADWFGAFEIALEDADEKENEEKEENGSSSRAAKRRKPNVPAPSTTRKGKARAIEQPNGHPGTNGHTEADDGHEVDTTRKRRHEARFLSAAADLAYLGVVQPTKRKAEHVARVVF
jgi:origin recognition complex subunit 3